jgi:hypothetical protein
MTATQLAQIFGTTSTPVDRCEGKRTYSREPISDAEFLEALPETLPGGVAMSQSFIKKLLEVIEGDLCGKRLYETRIARNYEEATGDAATMGHRFEYLVTGEQPAHGEKDVSQPLLTSRGKPSADELRIAKNAEVCREVLADLSAPYCYVEAGTRLVFKCMEGTLDKLCYPIQTPEANQRARVIDLKYSGLLYDRWHPWGWVNIQEKEGTMIQAKHYTLLARLLFGPDVEIDFFFVVFNSKKVTRQNEEVFGDYKPFRVRFSDEAMNEHKHFVLSIIEQYKLMHEGKKFTARPSYKGCADCPVSDCKSRRTRPEIEEIYVD